MAKTIRTNRTEYNDGYSARVNGRPIPHTVSRSWARGYHDAWRNIATGAAQHGHGT